MSVLFDLAPSDVSLARSLAEDTYRRHKGDLGQYRNLPRSHFVGKLGEVSVERWTRSHGLDPDPAYRDPAREREPDLILGGLGIAVKTWRPATWPEWGRCVTPAQIHGMQKKCKAIIWAVVDDESDPMRVEIPGWSTPDELAATAARPTGPEYRQIMNHQLDLDQLRDPDQLIRLLTRHSREAPAPTQQARLAHPEARRLQPAPRGPSQARRR